MRDVKLMQVRQAFDNALHDLFHLGQREPALFVDPLH